MSRGPMRRGLLAMFGSTLFQLSGIFMLSPLLLLMLLLQHWHVVFETYNYILLKCQEDY